MAINAAEAFNSPLSLFSSLYQDMNPIDLPEGLSPANEDMWFIPGSVQTRPGLNGFLSPRLSGNPTIMSVADFPMPSGDYAAMFLDSLGNLSQRLASATGVTVRNQFSAGAQFKAESAFNKQWYASFAPELTAAFSANPFVGVDVPRYYDGQNVWRVTQDAPGQPPAAIESNVSEPLKASPNGLISFTGLNVTQISQAGTVGTVTLPTASLGFTDAFAINQNDSFTISGAGVAAYNGTWAVSTIAVGGTVTTITFAMPAGGLASTGAGIITFALVIVAPTADLGLLPGQLLKIAGAGVGGYDGTWPVRALLPGSPDRYIVYLPVFSLANSGGGTAAVGGTIAAGLRQGVLMFKSLNGAITAPSIPFFWTATGGLPVLLNSIAIGPPGTLQRILAFAPAGGANFYYIPPALIPSTTGGPPTISQGTIINDNVSQSATLDFTDEALTAGVQIDIEGNDLFNQIVLAPCLGVIEYQQRLFWWGEINNIKNLTNPGFDGGYIATFGGTPLGWINDPNSTGGTSGSAVVSEPVAGFAFAMTSAGGIRDCMISQHAYQDYYGAPILQPGTSYIFRLMVSLSDTVSAATGNLIAEFYSPTDGSLSIAAINLAGLARDTLTWQSAAFSSIVPSPLPSDTLLRIYLQGVTSTLTVTIDEVELIDAAQPVLAQQMRASYVANPFGYDEITGLLGIDSTDSITAAFKQRGYLYPLTNNSQFQTQNNGSTEPDEWAVTQFAQVCGCSGPCAVDSGEGVAIWAGRYGRMLFAGDTPKKISQELQPTWDRINWAVETRIWLVNDPVERILYTGLPLDQATAPSIVQPVSYRSVDTAYNVPDPIHTSYSGKLIATDLCRKSTIWNVKANCGAMITQPLLSGEGIARQMIFGGGNGLAPGVASGFGQLYRLDFAKRTDDDYGVIGTGTGNYYITYAWWNHEIEQSAPGLGLHRKLYSFLSAYVTGVGNLQITPYVDTLSNPAPALRPYALLEDGLTHDLEWGLNITGDRVFFKIQAVPFAAATPIQNIEITDNELIVTVPNNYSPGMEVSFSGLAIATFLNGQTVTITSVFPTGFMADFTHADFPSTPSTAGTVEPESTTDAAFNINHLVVAGRMDKVFPTRGAYL